MPNAKYSLLKGVDLQEESVDELVARWLVKAKLDVDPALVTLRLVPCGVRTPSPAEELDAKVLAEPRLKLAAAGIFDGCSLLVDTESIEAAREDAERAKEDVALQRAKLRAMRGAHLLFHVFPHQLTFIARQARRS